MYRVRSPDLISRNGPAVVDYWKCRAASLAQVHDDEHDIHAVNVFVPINVVLRVIVGGGRVTIGIRVCLGGTPKAGHFGDVVDVYHAIVIHVPGHAAGLQEAGHRRTCLASGSEPAAVLDDRCWQFGRRLSHSATGRSRLLGLRETGCHPGEADQRDTRYENRCNQGENNTAFHNTPLVDNPTNTYVAWRGNGHPVGSLLESHGYSPACHDTNIL